jgi:hypothetical protein
MQGLVVEGVQVNEIEVLGLQSMEIEQLRD